jgi:hypothetical protein
MMRRYLTDPVLVFLTAYTALMLAECVKLHRTLGALERTRQFGEHIGLSALVEQAHATTTFN